MKVVTKMVINRDEIHFCYAEKMQDKSEIKYRVYFDNENVEEYGQTVFHDTFTADQKLKIGTFSQMAERELIGFYHEDEKLLKAYEVFRLILSNIKYNKNEENPNIPVHLFVSALTEYNKFSLINKQDYIDYEDDYNLINAIYKSENIKLVKDSYRFYENVDDKDKYADELLEKPIERVRVKYD